MKQRLTVALVMLAGVVLSTPRVEAQNRSLEDVFRGMDGVSAEFADVAAGIERETHTSFINHSSFEYGRLYFVRNGEDSRIRIAIADPAPKEVVIGDGTGRRYNPRTKVLEEFGLGEYADRVEFLVLGFGTSSQDLLDQYEISLGGEETVGGVAVSVLDLVPRDPVMARNFPQISLWLDQASWLPVQTRLEQPSGDYQIARFSDVMTNAGLPDSVFELDLPDDVQVTRH